MDLSNHVAVITGAAVGIGRGIALTLARAGANIATLDIDPVGNAETARLVQETGRTAIAIDCDVADRAQVRRAMSEVLHSLGRIDLLVNNAAIYIDTSLTTGTYDSQTNEYQRSMSICALGSYYCARAAVPAMQQVGGGNIINIITEHIKEGHLMTGPGASGYDGAKWVMWRQTESWAVELKEHNIRVNGLCMGATDTPMLRAVSVPIAEAAMKVEDVGQAVMNVLAHGEDGPTGESYLFGTTGTARDQSLKEIAALAPAG
ncbi:MAG: SDR family oxidoreductase [Gammaproteobacteria bacterium]|nr:SDR family oxidoreductase [Gammaproteobacteria bacterium]